MNANDRTIYKIPELHLAGTKENLNMLVLGIESGHVRGKAITNEDITQVIGYIPQNYEYGNDIFETSLKAKAEKQSMCNKQKTIKELTAAATALIEKYNSVIQDREWVAMQAVARVNGFTYRGPWIMDEINTLANAVKEANKQGEPCHTNYQPETPLEM